VTKKTKTETGYRVETSAGPADLVREGGFWTLVPSWNLKDAWELRTLAEAEAKAHILAGIEEKRREDAGTTKKGSRLGRAVAAHMEENREVVRGDLVAAPAGEDLDDRDLRLFRCGFDYRRQQAVLFRVAARVAEASARHDGEWTIRAASDGVRIELMSGSPVELAALLATLRVALDSPTLGEPNPRMPNASRLVPAPKEVL
jgi:hypothetical protein